MVYRIRERHGFAPVDACGQGLTSQPSANSRRFFEWFRDREDVENERARGFVDPEGRAAPVDSTPRNWKPDPQLDAVHGVCAERRGELRRASVRRGMLTCHPPDWQHDIDVALGLNCTKLKGLRRQAWERVTGEKVKRKAGTWSRDRVLRQIDYHLHRQDDRLAPFCMVIVYLLRKRIGEAWNAMGRNERYARRYARALPRLSRHIQESMCGRR
jgi:hypothetical protein